MTHMVPSGRWRLVVRFRDEELLDLDLDLHPGEKRTIHLFDELPPASRSLDAYWKVDEDRAAVWATKPLNPTSLDFPVGLVPMTPSLAAEEPPGDPILYSLRKTPSLPVPPGRVSLVAFPGKIGSEGLTYVVVLANDTPHALFFKPWNDLVTEALDKDGIWKPIEAWNYSTAICGTGMKPIILPKESGYLFVARRYAGSFRTRLRVALREWGKVRFRSNAFEGSVNPGQFVQTPLE